MRIIAGKYKGRRLKGPGSKNDFTRPMLDRVRESLFNILSDFPMDKNVLDLCSGTGSIGLEAMSRGASFCTFVEKSPINVRTIEHNIAMLGLQKQSKIINAELPKAIRFIKGGFDLLLFDPPFALDLAERTIPVVLEKKILNPNAYVIIERSKLSNDLKFEQLHFESKRVIGDSVLWIFKFLNNEQI